MGDLGDLRVDLPRMLADLEPLQHAVGQFAKSTALDAVTRDLGADRRMSGKPVTLGAGYDVGNPVVLHLRPAGLWYLVDAGRRRRGPIVPKRRSGKQAVTTPQGPRSSASFGPSRGLNTLDDTETAINAGIGKAVDEAIGEVLRIGGWS